MMIIGDHAPAFGVLPVRYLAILWYRDQNGQICERVPSKRLRPAVGPDPIAQTVIKTFNQTVQRTNASRIKERHPGAILWLKPRLKATGALREPEFSRKLSLRYRILYAQPNAIQRVLVAHRLNSSLSPAAAPVRTGTLAPVPIA